MTIKRLVAFLGAVALIIGALVIRNGLDDASSASNDSTDAPSGGATTVICSTQFAEVCKGLGKNYAVTVESAGATLDRLSKDAASVPDAWITLDPFPGMLDTVRALASLPALTTSVTAVAGDTPVLAVPKDRSSTVDAGCNGDMAWKCLGAAAGQTWASLDASAAGGDVLVGLTDPATDDVGLLTFANAVAGYFGVAQQDNSSFRDPGFTSWLRSFSNNVKIVAPGTTPLATLLVRKTEVNVAASSTSEIEASQRKAEVTSVPVSPTVALTAVVATFTSRGKSVAAKVTPLFLTAGWAASAVPQPQLPAGTFVALRALWREYNK